LGQDFRLSLVYSDKGNRLDLPGLEVLDEAEVALFAVRRRMLPKEQLDHVRKFVADGKPVVGIRTASHGFAPSGDVPPGTHVWPQFDREVLGGNYHGHFGERGETNTIVKVISGAEDHPVLNGVAIDGELALRSWMYKVDPLVDSATPLLQGRTVDGEAQQPVAWTNTHTGGGRVFYTSLGHPDDFKVPQFERLLRNGVYWAAGLTP
jgi:type 1 glutamine amidotransferase